MLKRMLKISLFALGIVLFSACGMKKPIEEKPLENEWGVTLSVEDVTPTGLKYIWSQSGVELLDELITGYSYTVEEFTKNGWVEVEELEPASFRAVGIPIDMNRTFFYVVDWEERYGVLESGRYRIAKEVWVRPHDKEVEDRDVMWYAEFNIE